ncbi:DUF397 domain-containing protein [Lentzea sp. NPDC006480]|uniref:DUF397 domain-containing protein n=1 Tax=Lentzea sp. NPDC006480 TaxID=3157176 RepID=UPI0033BBC796
MNAEVPFSPHAARGERDLGLSAQESFEGVQDIVECALGEPDGTRTLLGQRARQEPAWPVDGVAVRDSKNPEGLALRFSRAAWSGLLALNNGVDGGRPATAGHE